MYMSSTRFIYTASRGERQTSRMRVINFGTAQEVAYEIWGACKGSNDTAECRNDSRPESASRYAAVASGKGRRDAQAANGDGAGRLSSKARTLAYARSPGERPGLRPAK